MPAGRPCEYTKSVGDFVCKELAGGKSLNSICKSADMPLRQTVVAWVIKGEGEPVGSELREFSNKYARARDIQYDLMVDECKDIADDSTNDYMEGKGVVLNREAIQRSKLRIDTRLTIAERCRPKKYGKTANIDHSSSDGTMTPQDPVKSLAQMYEDINSNGTTES